MIAARESDSGDIQFAGNSDGHRLKSAIEDNLAESAVRRSEIDLLAGRDGVAEVAGDGGFGGSVDVDERSSRRPGAHQVRRGRLAAHRDGGQFVDSLGIHRRQRCRRDERVGDMSLAENVGQFGSPVDGGGSYDQFAADGEGEQVLENGGVEARRGEMQCARFSVRP